MKLRLDRLATLYIASPLMRLASVGKLSIPILMYHAITDEDESRMHPYYRTTTSPAVFLAHMQYLHQSGYQTCSPTQAIARLKTDGPVAKTVAITFDDGYRDFYLNAFPVMNQFGFTATVFLPTAYIGEATLQFKERDCLTWSEVRELQRYGISFGSHTVTHPQLRYLDKDAIEREIVNSKEAIEERTGGVVDSFAYPYAFPQTDAEFKKRLRDSLHRAGYHSGVCTIVGRVGPGSDPLFIERLPINSLDDTALFQAKLAGAYDWISRSQYVVKRARALGANICCQR